MHAHATTRAVLRFAAQRAPAARASCARAAARAEAAASTPLSGGEGRERVLSSLAPLMRAFDALPAEARNGAKTALSQCVARVPPLRVACVAGLRRAPAS